MATVEKRRSSRKSGHRKHNDGGYSDTETDREVSSLTDRAFRSLCIGDEAVYNDSDLSASPCAQKDTGRQELKRTAHESFSLRVQQYGQDWIYRGTYGAEIHKGQQWGVYGEKGAPEPPQQGYPPRELSLFSNGMTEVSSQQRRSHSRVSSLIRAFNSEGQGDEAVYNDETSWDKASLMTIEGELSEFSSYPQNMNTGYFPSAGIFSSQNTDYYSSQVAAISQMNSASSFMRSSHSLSTQVNSNFFIHSEFSPFKVWRDQNRFPFHGGQVSGFMPRSEFQKWYETPMYKELSLQPQQHPSMFSQGYHRNTFAPAIPMNSQRSTSASTMMQRASAVEKRCESELAGQYRKRTQSMGANRLPPQRPSTASPSSEMSRRVRDTISSVKSLQQKIKMMAERNVETQRQDELYNNDYLNAYDPMVPNIMSSNPYTAPYQIQKSSAYAPPEPQQLLQQHSASPQPVEHAPVRAESRGATPDVKMSSYKSRAASLLYNLKDNRKRVKATYSPNAFKGQDTQEKYKQEAKDFIIDVPEFSANELLNSTDDRGHRLNVPQYGYQAHSPGMHMQNSQPVYENSTEMGKINVPQYGYQVYNSGMPQNAQPDFVNPVENSTNKLNVPQYGYQARSPGMPQNSQHMQNSHYHFVNPIEDRGNRLDVGQYGYQAHSPGMQQNIQFSQFSQNTQNSQQFYSGQSSSEYYRAQMQGEVAPHPGFTGYSHEYYANTQLTNGQNPYENISSFAPYKQSMSDKGGGNYVNQLEQNTEVQRFGAVVQSRDYVSKDNNTQQFNEAASGEYTGLDRYNQLKENKYDYNNVYSQDTWGQTNSQQIQKPGIPSAQNYQNINAYSRTNAQENVQNYNYEQKVMENYGARPHGTANVSNQMVQYALPHQTNTGNAGYNTQQQPGTYRDIYAPPSSHEFNKEIKMKENYAPRDNHKYYHQESKTQTIISSQAGMPIATEELGQRIDEAIKKNGMKGLQSKETRYTENNKEEKKTEQEQVKDISKRDQATNEQVFLQQNKLNVHKAEINEIKDRSKLNSQQHKEHLEKEAFTKYRSAQDTNLPTAEEMIKQLRKENSNSDHTKIQEVIDRQECMMESEPQRPEPEKQQPIVQHANTERLKEEPIKCELAASNEEARIEQVKPEPSRKERVTTEQATEPQAGAEHDERVIEEDRNEAKQAVMELLMESQANTKPEENKDIEIIDVKDKIPETEVQESQEELEVKFTEEVKVTDNRICEEHTKMQQIPKAEATNVNNVESVSKSEPQQPATHEPDKVEQTKTELAKTKAELAKIKEQMKGEPKVEKDEDEHTEQENDSAHTLSKEPPVTSADLNDRGTNDFGHIREKYGYSQATARNKTFTSGNVNEQSTIPDKDDKLIEYRMDTNQDKKANSEVLSDTIDDNDKTNKNLYDDPTGSQYVYSESSKDFKLSIACNEPAHEETENTSGFVSTKEAAPVEKVEKSNVPQLRDDAKQHLVNKCKMSQSNWPDNAAKEAILKNDACELNDPVPVEKVEKYDISQQKDAKQVPIERKTKSADHKTGSSKEISTKCVTHKEKAQTKQEILTSKIKAHAEKEISAIKEGFANKDGLKNPTKSLGIGQNVSIRQKPPSQEVYKKQERSVDGDTSKVSAALTDTGEPADTPLKHMKNNENTKERVETVANNELHTSTKSFKMTENHTVQKDKKCGSPTDDKKIKPQHEDKSIKQDYLRKEDKVDLENTAPSLQLQNEISSQDNSLSIMGIMVTVRERNSSEENKDQDVKHGPHVETNITRLSDKVNVNEQNYTEAKHFEKMQETDSTTHKNFTDSTTEKTGQHESSFPKERPQSETLLPDHLAEKVVPPTVTVPAKNKVLAETQALPNKHDIMARETKVCANKPPNAALDTTGIKDQKEITDIRRITEELPTTEMKRVISVSTTSCDNTQEDILHIDSIAIQVVPAVAEEVNKAPQRTASNCYFTEKETQSNIQKSVPSNDDVQKVLSSVKRQAQLLKNSNQPNLNNTSRESSENEKTTNEVETHKPPMEEGYFQVDKRDTVPQNNHTSMGLSSETVSQERKLPRSLPNQPSSAIKQDQNIKTSIQIDNSPNDKSNKDEKPGVGHLHHTRRHPMAKGRQRGFATLPDSNDSKIEVKPKPKVPIPEISALADYARLKVIVSKDDEDTLQEQPPNKKEGFFPLIQSRHSRRPVFTMDSQEDPVKEKSSQNQSSTQVKVSKEPTPVVFPITDKQHQRTGMFKLEAKENADVQKIEESKPTSMDQTPQDKTNNKEKNAEDKIKDMLEKSRAKQAEEEKRTAQREEEQRALEREAIVAQIRERRKKQREAERHMEEGKGKEQKGETEERNLLQQNVSNNEQQKEQLSERELSIETNPDGHDRMLQKKTASNTQRKMDAQNDLDQHKEAHIEEQQRNAEEQKKKDSVDEHQKRAALEEQHKKVAQIEEQRRKAAKEEQLRKAALEEQTRRANEEQQRKAEEQKKAILEEKQRKAAQMEEEKRIMLLKEQQRRAAQKEQQRKMVEEEQQKQAAIIEEQKKKAAFEEQQKKLAHEEQQRKAAQEEQKQKTALEEQQKRVAQKEQQRKIVEEEQQKQATIIEEQKKKAAIEEQHRKLAQEEQQRKAAQEEQKQKAALEEQQRIVAQKEQQRKMTEEEQRRQTAIIEEQKKKAAIEEQQRKLAQEEQQRKAALEEQQQRAAQKEHQRKMVEEEQRRQAAIIEEQKKKALEEQRKLAHEEQQRKAALEEQKQQQQRMAQKEQQRKMAEEEQQRRAAIIEEQKKAALEEQRKLAHEEQQRKAQEEQLRKMAEEEQQRKAAIIEEQKKRATIEEQQRKMAQAAHEEKKRKAALEEQQRRAALEEQKQKAVLEEQQRRAAETEQLRKMAEEEQQRKAAIIEEQKKKAAFEEQQRKLAYEEQQKQAALEEQKKQKAALEEQQRRAAQKEQQRKMAEEEQQRKAAIIEEQKKRAAVEEQQRKVAQEEQQKRAALEEKKQKAALEEQQRRAAQKEQQMKMAEEEKQRKAAIIEEQKKRAAIEEHNRKAEEQRKKEALIEEQQRRAALKEEQRRAALEEQLRKNKMAEEEQRRKEALEEQRKVAQTEEMRRQAAHEEKLRKAAEIEERKRIAALQEEQQRKAKLEEKRQKSMMEEERKIAQIEEKRRQAAHEEQLKKAAETEEQKRRAALEEQKRKAVIEEQRKLAQIKEMRRQAAHEEQLRKIAEEEQQKKAVIIEEERRAVLEEQQRSEAHKEQLKKAAKIEEQKKKAELEEQKQKAAIEEWRRKDSLTEKQRQTRQEEEEKRLAYIREERIRRQIEEEREVELEEEMTRRQQSSEQNQTHTGKDTRRFRGQDLPRNQTEVRARPETAEMEEQKNTSDKEALQYYSLTSAEAEKPSPPQKRSNANGPDTVDDMSRPYAPASPAPSQSRSTTASPAFGTKPSMFKVKDNTLRGSSVTKSIKPRFHKNFGEEFRVGSPMERVWEKNEGDLDTLRCRTPSTPLPQYRPFSRRSLALDEEDSRSIISNLSEDVESFATNATDLADIRALYDSDRPESACSFSSDVSRSFGRPPAVPPKSEKALRRAKRLATRRLKKELAKDVTEESYEDSMSEVPNSDVVASPHFTPPISIARAPPAGSSVSLSHSEPAHQSSLHTAPHATGPISLPNSSSHTSTPVSSAQNPGSFSTPAAPRSIPQVPSSPTHHNAPKPVTQYQVESGFSQSYTQRRVMQDIGSGQYYVVDVPVEVKTKTFFDPETGKYVQLNVRESNRNATQGQPLQGYPQPHLKPKLHAKLQPNTSGNAQYQGDSSNSKGYQSAATSSGQSMTPATVIQDQQPIRSSMAHRHGGPETSYSPDKTPYMDTVNKVDKAHHSVYNTQGSQGAITEGDSQLVNSRYGSRDIISMSELEDFMEVSDW